MDIAGLRLRMTMAGASNEPSETIEKRLMDLKTTSTDFHGNPCGAGDFQASPDQ